MEGGSAREFMGAKRMLYSDPVLFERVCAMLSEVIIDYLNLQIRAGVDAVQIFDTLGGTLAATSSRRVLFADPADCCGIGPQRAMHCVFQGNS